MEGWIESRQAGRRKKARWPSVFGAARAVKAPALEAAPVYPQAPPCGV